jgi:hypothetical protein
VTDSGAGISDENQKKLFKEIVQFNPEKLQAGGGSGLGLWISSGIMELHNGKISVFSEGEGKGCSFMVEIPMIRQSPPRISIQPLKKHRFSFTGVLRNSNRSLFLSGNNLNLNLNFFLLFTTALLRTPRI